MATIVLAGGNTSVHYEHSPDVCPQCHHAINPIILTSTLNGIANQHGTRLDISFKCTHRDCFSMFIGQYTQDVIDQGTRQLTGVYNLKQTVPLKFKFVEFSFEVIQISSSFKTIYNQASEAENYELNEICGVGYRKALEFLIKDYCIHKNPSNEDEIKSMLLGQVINKFVDDTNLKACAQRAAWLGNDETHYIRKWEDRDIKDLKDPVNNSV